MGSRPGERDRGGATVVDLLIGSAGMVLVMVLVVGGLWLARRGEESSGRDVALQSVLIAQERIVCDLRQLIVQPGCRAIRVSPDGKSIGFWAVVANRSSGVELAAKPVIWRCGLDRGHPALQAHDAGRWESVGYPAVTGATFTEVRSPAGLLVRAVLETTTAGGTLHTCFTVRLTLGRSPVTNVIGFRKLAPFPVPQLDPSGRS